MSVLFLSTYTRHLITPEGNSLLEQPYAQNPAIYSPNCSFPPILNYYYLTYIKSSSMHNQNKQTSPLPSFLPSTSFPSLARLSVIHPLGTNHPTLRDWRTLLFLSCPVLEDDFFFKIVAYDNKFFA